jgi:membrane protein required for beta-lactamase induction
MNSHKPGSNLDADWLVALFWMVPGVFLACVYLVLALAMSPLLIPYIVIRRVRGRDATNRLAEWVVALLVVLVCGYQVTTWLADPASFYWPRGE